MAIRTLFLMAVALFLTGCATPPPFTSPNATGHYAESPEQCVPYARRMSGIDLRGDAYSWWDQAGPSQSYSRGQTPRLGAVLVLARTKQMPQGHLSVINRLIDSRHVGVTHSNWGSDRTSRRVVYDSMVAEDLSLSNNWTRVRFWNYDKNCFGFPYAAKGFIYK
jgi:hypothetical protein